MTPAEHRAAKRVRHGQRVVSCTEGDCFRASMSYVLDLPNDDRLPHVPLVTSWMEWLYDYGLDIKWVGTSCWQSGLWIASVPSKNCPGATHAIVMRGLQIEFDPSPRRRYRRGLILLGVKQPPPNEESSLVIGGYAITVTDASLLYKLDLQRKQMGGPRPVR